MTIPIQTPKIYFNKYTARFLLILLVLGLAASQIFWVGRLFARLWDFPELRHSIDVQLMNDGKSSFANLSVTNKGFGNAEKIMVHISTKGLPISGYEIESQELYEIKSINLKNGILNIWLDRLAANASVEIMILGDINALNQLRLSATSQQGSSVSNKEQASFSEQALEWTDAFSNLYTDAWQIVSSSAQIKQIAGLSTSYSQLARIFIVLGSWDFQTVALAMISIVFVAWLFLSRRQFILLRAGCAWFLIWLFFDFLFLPLDWIGSDWGLSSLATWLMAGATFFIFLIVVFLSWINTNYSLRADHLDLIAVVALGIILGTAVVLLPPWILQFTKPARLVLPASMVAGLLLTLWVVLSWESK